MTTLYARAGARRLGPREARAIKSKIGKGEHSYYEKTGPAGRIMLPTVGEARPKGGEDLAPEMHYRIPRRMVNLTSPTGTWPTRQEFC